LDVVCGGTYTLLTKTCSQVQFRFIAVIAGNANNISEEEYSQHHIWYLNSSLEAVKPQYIVGTCSEKSAPEPYFAVLHRTILMAQVGPPDYYSGDNPYLFGFHINSDAYPQAAVQTLGVHAEETVVGGLEMQPVKVVYRTKSAFFKSTCESAIRYARDAGMTNITEISFDPFADDDEDGVVNAFDKDFLNGIADQACPPGSEQATSHPAIFVCSSVEQDQLLRRWKKNGCRPVSMWISASVASWAFDNPGAVPYMQGGAQWHPAFDYSDRYFNSGADLVSFTLNMFGYVGTHNLVAAYSTAVLFSQHIASHYRISNDPTVAQDFASEQGYEILRRDLLILTTDTLFGPFALNNFRRNVGRSAAASQWLPNLTPNATRAFRSKCISPSSQAEAATVIPTLAARDCEAGLYLRPKLIHKEESLLSSKCDFCPIGTFTSALNEQVKCTPCPEGSSTDDQTGSTVCIVHNLHLVPKPIQAMGYSFVGAVWFAAIHFLLWSIKNRKHPAVGGGADSNQFFLCSTLMAIGAMISSSSIIFLIAAEADDEFEDSTTAASKACVSITFLYTIGWGLEFVSMGVRVYGLFRESQRPKRVVSTLQMLVLVASVILVDMLVVVVWATVMPLEYTRRALGVTVDPNAHVLIVESIGQCSNSGGVTAWAFVAPLLVLHIGSILFINFYLLRRVDAAVDPYNERRYVVIVSVLTFEILIVGIAMSLAVGDSGKGKFIVLSSIVFLTDMSVLLFTFLPKIYRVDFPADESEKAPVDADLRGIFDRSMGAFEEQDPTSESHTRSRVTFDQDVTSDSQDHTTSSSGELKIVLHDHTVDTDDLTHRSTEDRSKSAYATSN
jgi:hypothetical protein